MWYIPMRGQLINLPLKDVTWNGNDYSFDISFQLGGLGIGGLFVVEGSVDETGNITGKFNSDKAGSAAGFLPFSDFTGQRPAKGRARRNGLTIFGKGHAGACP
jgi:hypothetical protein